MRITAEMDIDVIVEVTDQFGNEINADVDNDGGDTITVQVYIPQFSEEFYRTLCSRHPELREELELLKNEIELKENCVK